MSLIIIGIDPGTRQTGYGIIRFERQVQTQLAAGLIRLDARLPIHDRLVTLFSKLNTLIEAYQPSHLGIETAFINKNVASTMKLGHARGVILLSAAQAGLQIVELSPREIKRQITGNGNAGKPQVSAMVTRLLNLPEAPEPYDVTDALAIALSTGFRTGPGSSPVKALTQSQSRGKRSAWGKFLEQNPGRVVS
ncbi:MAG: crossover junction endodeoxyribonuclease RuvC [Bacteroidetes bacterium]|nr:crossover junction endodeoxyribonuclease RuvC [Bacteroidota bacterium]